MRLTKSRPREVGHASEQGSAPAEFTMVAGLLVMLCLIVIQFAGMIHVRNTLIDAASTGARFGALADRTAEDGVERTQQLITSAVSGRYVQDISHSYSSENGEGRILEIRVRAQVPVLGVLGGLGEVEVSGSAYEFP
ncbi:TadE family protein [Nesterenkonia massiliensis]|nr:TadE family protein [Nesterenkonia massiliensis]